MKATRRRRERRAGAITIATLSATLSGCLPASHTREGDSIAGLYTIAMVLAAGVAIVVWGLLIWVIVRYRRSPGRPEVPPQTRGHVPLETLWTAIPLLIVGVLFVLTLWTLNGLAAPPATPQVDLRVEAYRWGWRVHYPAAGVVVDGYGEPGPEAVLPVGRPVTVTLTSADVIHAFFVPQFLYKRDAIPGHPNTFGLTIERPGVYRGDCAEYCGLLHARMPFTIRAVSGAEFDAWLAAQPAALPQPPAAPQTAAP